MNNYIVFSLLFSVTLTVIQLVSCHPTLAATKSIKLNDGRSIPAVGLGSWTAKDEEMVQAVKDAINAGYRHIDTAWMYENEKAIGKGIKESIEAGVVKREDLFITTKVWNTFHSRTGVLESAKISAKNLGLDYVDLLLVHWPTGFKEGTGEIYPKDAQGNLLYSDVDYLETWAGMEDAHKAGIAKSIGVSNFNHKQIERLLTKATVKPVMNQVESHPYLTQDKLVEFCKNHSIVVTAYSPLARGGDLFKDKVLVEVAEKHKKSPAQIAIRFQVQRGVVVIPKSSNKKRIAENFSVFDFELTSEEMKAIEKLNKNSRVVAFTELKSHKYYPFNEPY